MTPREYLAGLERANEIFAAIILSGAFLLIAGTEAYLTVKRKWRGPL